MPLDDLKAIVATASLKVFEPMRTRSAAIALSAGAIFDAVFRKDRKNAEEIVFVSMDGYRAIVPVAKFAAHIGYLKRWIENPRSIRYNTVMPGLGSEIVRREQVAEELIAYLKAMSTGKRDPSSRNDGDSPHADAHSGE